MSANGDDRPDVSVVVPVYNSVDTVGRTLSALRQQRFSGRYEVIVVDGGSDDGTRELLEQAGDSIIVLHNELREPASSRNLGVRQARAAVIAFTDADCEPDPEWLQAGLSALSEVDIVQGRVVPWAEQGPFDRSLWVTHEHGLYETANLFVRRQAFEAAGGFELVPGLVLAHGTHFGEDAWLVWRARRRGARTAFCVEALVRHAVVPRGIEGILREAMRRRHFPQLVKAIPELRAAFMYCGGFLGPVAFRFDLAVFGALVAASGRRRRGAVVLALPYAADRWDELRHHPRRARPRLLAGRVAEDAVSLGALLWGSARARTIVL